MDLTPMREMSATADQKISDLREKFFNECTDTDKESGTLKKINTVPHSVFEWFKPHLAMSIDQERCWCGEPVYKHAKCYKHYMLDLPGGAVEETTTMNVEAVHAEARTLYLDINSTGLDMATAKIVTIKALERALYELNLIDGVHMIGLKKRMDVVREQQRYIADL